MAFKKPIKPVERWVIWNKRFGFYVDQQLTKREAIAEHVATIGDPWEVCQARGDEAIKVILTPATREA
jgi:hypothetical protein